MYVNPKLPIYPSLPSFPFGNQKFIFKVCESVFCLNSVLLKLITYNNFGIQFWFPNYEAPNFRWDRFMALNLIESHSEKHVYFLWIPQEKPQVSADLYLSLAPFPFSQEWGLAEPGSSESEIASGYCFVRLHFIYFMNTFSCWQLVLVFKLSQRLKVSILNNVKNKRRGLPWWRSGWESAC